MGIFFPWQYFLQANIALCAFSNQFLQGAGIVALTLGLSH
jgi:hypothetical protein